ncbi:MAG: hypothetical protein M1502_02670 [Deltaproteobacteria bacterium]|nr:hypothetical protein [Deltaproteobacteria bacterium]
MSAESVKENAIRKVIQEIIVPDLQKIISKVEILDERLNSVRTELKSDIANLDLKIDSVRTELKSDINRLENKIEDNEEKMDIKISALSEKVDLMNKFNDKLFDTLHTIKK